MMNLSPSTEWSVYLLRCSDDTLYCGVTKDWKRRLEKHNAGRGAKYTRGRTPVELVSVFEGLSHSDALKREARVKRAPRSKKLEVLQALHDD